MHDTAGLPPTPRPDARPWTDEVFDRPAASRLRGAGHHVIGVLEGEGVGPEVIRAALRVLSAVEEATGRRTFALRFGGPIGRAAESVCGTPLSAEVAAFCGEVFAAGGAVLAGPGGGRFVYDLRKRFDLFCKLSPLVPHQELLGAGRLKAQHLRGVDILLVRENTSGVYQGRWAEARDERSGERRAEHSFWYTEPEVRRIVRVAARIAARRRGSLTVVVKDAAVPTVSALWRDCAAEVAREAGVRASFANVDLAAYLLVQHPSDLDVVVAPNLFGDVLADVGAVLLGSRGISFSGNFAADGAAVFQTNHGAAHDLAGTDRANPVGQVHSLAMLLRESFGLVEEAALVEAAIADVLRAGVRTHDLAEDGCRVAGTREMGERIAASVERVAAPARRAAGR